MSDNLNNKINNDMNNNKIKDLICIVCPKGCRLKVDTTNEKDYKVSGYGCEKGIAYGIKELTNPTRTVTSTVRIVKSARYFRLPVKTDKEIEKDKIFKVMEVLKMISVKTPIQRGDIIISNILGTDVNIVSTKTIIK